MRQERTLRLRRATGINCLSCCTVLLAHSTLYSLFNSSRQLLIAGVHARVATNQQQNIQRRRCQRRRRAARTAETQHAGERSPGSGTQCLPADQRYNWCGDGQSTAEWVRTLHEQYKIHINIDFSDHSVRPMSINSAVQYGNDWGSSADPSPEPKHINSTLTLIKRFLLLSIEHRADNEATSSGSAVPKPPAANVEASPPSPQAGQCLTLVISCAAC